MATSQTCKAHLASQESPEHTQLHQLRFFQQQRRPAEIPEGRQTARLHQLQQHLAAENLKLTTSSSSQSAAASTSWNTWRETDPSTTPTTGQPPAASSSWKPEVYYIKFESISSSVYQLKYLKGDRLDYGQSAAVSTSWIRGPYIHLH